MRRQLRLIPAAADRLKLEPSILLLSRDRLLRQRPVKNVSQDCRRDRDLHDRVELEPFKHGIGNLTQPAQSATGVGYGPASP
jgi:hypothetical protein